MLRAPTALVVSASLFLSIACGARTPAVLAPGELPSRAEVTLVSSTPFFYVGRTALEASLRCPAVSLTGRLGTTRGDTLQFVDVFEHQFVPGAPPGCWEMKRGRVVQDRSQPITITVAAQPRPRSPDAFVLAGVAAVIIVAIVLKWKSFSRNNASE